MVEEIEDVLGKGILEKILNLLFEENPLSYNQISEKISIDYGTLKKTMIRNKDYFQESSKDGKTKFFKLSILGEKFVREKLEDYKKKQDYFKELDEALKRKQVLVEELSEEVKNIIQNKEINLNREGKSIYIDVGELAVENPALSEMLLEKPDEVIGVFKNSLEKDYDIRFKNLPKTAIINIEELRQEHLNKLIMVECRSVSLSNVRPIIKNIKFECPSCGTVHSVLQNDSFIRRPSRCSCGRKGGFREISKEMVNAANVMLEDLQEKTENPNLQRIRALIQKDLTEPANLSIFIPGNEIRAVGILREVSIFNKGKQSVSLGFVFEILSAELFEPEVNISNFTEEDIEKIKQLSKDIDEKGMGEINTSFAPDIYGYEQIKNALIFQLCNEKNDPNSPTRNKPNILLMGDPGIAKSVLAKFSISLTPGSREAVGGGSSAVGITASVIKEEENLGGYRVEPGALILAKEILLIDELNNLSDEDKPKLQEGMGQQSVTINKANLHVKLRVTAGILATANPKNGSFNPTEDPASQFNIPSPIINRFDEIFIMIDYPEENRDREIANKMIKREKGEIKPKYDIKFLKKFFIYARNFSRPEIDDNISKKLQILYVKIRKEKTEKLIINPRFVEALTRLIKASAKIRLSNKVKDKDIERALDILNKTHFQTSEYSRFNFDEKPVYELSDKEKEILQIQK
jgi:replicative DNA helicase Mcm